MSCYFPFLEDDGCAPVDKTSESDTNTVESNHLPPEAEERVDIEPRTLSCDRRIFCDVIDWIAGKREIE